MKVPVVLAVTVVVMWLGLVMALVILRPRGVDLAEAKRFVPDVLRLLRSLVRDKSLARGLRTRLLLLLGYLACPVDLLPDFIPVLGYADDVIVIALVLRSVVRRAGRAALTEHWQGSDQGLAAVGRLAGVSLT